MASHGKKLGSVMNLTKGQKLILVMGPKANKEWEISAKARSLIFKLKNTFINPMPA